MPASSLADLLELYPENRQETMCSELLTKQLGYSTQFGDSALRAKLASSLYPQLKAKNFLITTGASEAISLVFNTLFNAGDCIIVQKPIYQSLYQIAEDRRVKIIDWDCDLENYTWHLDELQALISANPNCKGLVINNPNNPTGIGFDKDTLEKIIVMLDDRYLISDEVFRNISPSPIPSAIELYEQAIVISDLSKSFNMPGLRIGWIASSTSLQAGHKSEDTIQKNVLELFSSYKNYLSLRSPTISETIAVWVLEMHEQIAKQNKQILKNNIDQLYSCNRNDLFFELKFSRERIMGLSIFPQLKEEFKNLDCKTLLDKQKLFIAGGEYFAPKYQGFCRIGLGQLDLKSLKISESTRINGILSS